MKEHKMKQILTRPLLLLIILLSMVACKFDLAGNGDGYDSPKSTVTSPQYDRGHPIGLEFKLEYFEIEDGYTCLSPDNGEEIPSYRSKVIINDQQFSLIGDRCENDLLGSGSLEELDGKSANGSHYTSVILNNILYIDRYDE
jgi:hypothetical protein